MCSEKNVIFEAIEKQIYKWALAYVENETCIPETGRQYLSDEEYMGYMTLYRYRDLTEKIFQEIIK